MQNPETLATLGTHDTGQDTKKTTTKTNEKCVIMVFWYFHAWLIYNIVWYSVRLYLQLFERGLMSSFHYACLFAYSGVQTHIVLCILSSSCVLCTLCCQFLWVVHYWLPLRFSLTFAVIITPGWCSVVTDK